MLRRLMPRSLPLVVWAACARHPATDGEDDGHETGRPPNHSGGSTGTPHSATVPTDTAGPDAGVPAATRILPTPGDLGFATGLYALGDTNGDGRPDLGISQGRRLAVITRPLPRGVVSIDDLATGGLPTGLGAHLVDSAGDTDSDGFGDVWMSNSLYRGPFDRDFEADEEAMQVLSPGGSAPAGGFDADGDGFLDVAFGSNSFEVHYGPFTTDRTGEEPDISRSLDVSGCDVQRLMHLGAVNEPGQIVLTSGWQVEQYCQVPIQIHDIRGPRGQRFLPREAIATFDYTDIGCFMPLPDVNGDGLDDILYCGQPLTAPIAGEHPLPQPDDPTYVLDFFSADVIEAMPDATGDGLGDLLVCVNGSCYVVPGTTRGVGLDPADFGVPLRVDLSSNRSWLMLDLDLDGLSEVIVANSRDWVDVFSGADIAAAQAVLHP